MKNILEYQNMQGILRMAIVTSDSYGLYKEFDFKSLNSPESFMELHQLDVYK
jgi:hypothetical protein